MAIDWLLWVLLAASLILAAATYPFAHALRATPGQQVEAGKPLRDMLATETGGPAIRRDLSALQPSEPHPAYPRGDTMVFPAPH